MRMQVHVCHGMCMNVSGQPPLSALAFLVLWKGHLEEVLLAGLRTSENSYLCFWDYIHSIPYLANMNE